MSTSKPTLPPELQQALQRGDVLSAMKALRGISGMDLQAAKRAFEQQVRTQVQQQADAGRQAAGDKRAQAEKALEAMADKGRSPVRSAAHVITQQTRPPTIVMGDRPGDMRWVLIVAALLAAAVWVGFGGG